MALTIFMIVTLNILLRFQHRRRNSRTLKDLSFPIRNILFEWETRRSIPRSQPDSATIFDYSKSLLAYIDLHTCYLLSHNLDQEMESIRERYSQREQNFDLHQHYDVTDLPEDRYPAPGIRFAERIYHDIPSAVLNRDDIQIPISNDPSFIETPDARSGILYAESLDLSGAPPIPEIAQIIHDWFPHYEVYLTEYCRPPSYGPQAFLDFNRPTPSPAPPTPERHEAIMRVVRAKLAIKPYRPLHFADALAAETPLNTSASYFSKFDPRTRVYARYSAPKRYADRPTSKGYFINVMLNQFRREMHNVKDDGLPFPTGDFDPEIEADKLQYFFKNHPSQLFIRTQISKRDPSEPKKIRPVYSVDDRFLHIEKMLVTPALAQMRNPQCCIAHGLETFRGSMRLLDIVALSFFVFISLDWSQFDQRLPYYVIIAFFLDYIPSLLIVSHGYMPTRTYPDTTQPTPLFSRKMFNIVVFLLSWYLSMTFLSYDGFAYIREHGGVPSGLLNTQFLDSFGNMYIIVDCLLEYGFSESDCLEMLFCVLGDDNLIFLRQNFSRVHGFMEFLDRYAKQRHGMVLSILKSVYTTLRSKITFLSYENFYGMPTRPIGKLVSQLAMPERPIPDSKSWIHAARALGLAYANCGQDHTFHLLCEKVYQKFRPTTPVPTHHVQKIFRKWKHELPEFDIESVEYTFPEFPTLHEIRQLVHEYHGPFSEMDKWNTDVFNAPPSDNLPDFTTLKDFMNQDSEMSRTAAEFWHGKRSI
ncbi:RNA-dependent RNA polymerase [Betapartitivirus sp.]|nr:RNA-dependent RNA polymerase [Betapartitivirus sp.]